MKIALFITGSLRANPGVCRTGPESAGVSMSKHSHLQVGGGLTGLDPDLLDHLFEQRLQLDTFGRVLATFPAADRQRLLHNIDELSHRLSRLIDASNHIHETPSLNHSIAHAPESLDDVLGQLIVIISDAFRAERCTLFLLDPDTDELFSRVAMGDLVNEIRLPSSAGIAGAVFRSRSSLVINDAYADPRFNSDIDEQTGYRTRNILCVPLKNRLGEVIGVTEVLNKVGDDFGLEDRALLEAFASHAAMVLEHAHLSERAQHFRQQESQFMAITQAISSELHVDTLLGKIMAVSTELLQAERSTLFLYDAEHDELWSRVAEGISQRDIRFPASAGIAGAVFSSGKMVNIPDAYRDPRFNQEVDRKTGYRTRSILCLPVENKRGQVIGVVQVLNKKGGVFTGHDEKRLHLLCTQSAIALENARMFEDILTERNYSESILRSLSNGVLTLDRDIRIIKVNEAAARILGQGDIPSLLGQSLAGVINGDNDWVLDSLGKVARLGQADLTPDATLNLGGEQLSVNLSIEPLLDKQGENIGYVLVIEDITSETRIKTNMSRYMNKELTERLLDSGDAMLGGSVQDVTVMFTDICSFTGISEQIGARDTVGLLNAYFSEMVEHVLENDGILDKYIGDAIMAIFGTPFPGPKDADNALRAAIGMLKNLRDLNERRAVYSQIPIDIRIGINSGEVVAGNIGSQRRMDYTVVGDGVNVASRLEGANKYYGTRLLISEMTRERLQGEYLLRELGLIRVRGRKAPVPLYEVLDGSVLEESGDIDAILQVFAEGLSHYRARDWRRAMRCFARVLELQPRDGPAGVYLQRCRKYLEQPPAASWKGVWQPVD